MKKKKGFTLIELLAIIVILAIIAVITVPIILGIIDDSKAKASVASAYGFKDAVEKDYATKLLANNEQKLNGTYTITNGRLGNIDLPISGTKPSNGSLVYQNNKLISGCLTIDGYRVEYQNDKFTATKGDCNETSTVYYTYDPNATESENGYITNKQSSIDPSWEIYVKETSGPKIGYSPYSIYLYEDGNTHFSNYNECATAIQNLGAPSYVDVNCIKPYVVSFVEDEQTMYSMAILNSQKCDSLLNTESPETIAQLQAQCEEASFYVIEMSEYEADGTDEEIYSTLENCETSYHVSQYNSYPNDFPAEISECRQYTAEGIYQIAEVCGIESGNHFCINANKYNDSVDTLDNTFNNCSGNGYSYNCEGTLNVSIEDGWRTEIVKKNNMSCYVEDGLGYCEPHEIHATFVNDISNKIHYGYIKNGSINYYSNGLSGIKKFLRAESIDPNATKYLVSDSSLSNTPIYMWYNNIDTIYWYSEAERPRFKNSNISSTFENASDLYDISGVADWDTSNITTMGYVFYGTAITNVDALSNWNTSNVTTMSNMFGYAKKLTNVDGLSGWNTANLEDTENMFVNTWLLNDITGISNWNMSKVTNFQQMFYGSNVLSDASSLQWVTPYITSTNSRQMFNGTGVVTSGKYPTFYSDSNKTQVINGTWNDGTFTPSS